MSQITWLSDSLTFPSTNNALDDPNGLLAAGGDLSPERLVSAYSQGIFPWYSDGQPILWWTPSPRMVLYPDELHLGRTIKKQARRSSFKITVDTAFRDVIYQCATVTREGESGTWITDEINDAYIGLHELGLAHSVEAWQDDQLVGGLYGVALGKVFFGESMFSLESGASKIAFGALAQQLKKWGFKLIDCQIHTQYLQSFGAREVERDEFESVLKQAIPTLESNPPLASCPKSILKLHCDHNIDPIDNVKNSWSHNWSMPEHGFE